MTARLDGAELSALEISADQWQSVRETYRDRMLTMTCGERAIPKVSSRGLKYFAHHHPKSGCDLHETGPETVEHHMAKAVLANAARQAGWNAEVEVVSPTRDWIADVMISRGEKRIALEVQWSPQRTEDILARTRRYESSGVGCRWFLGPANHSRDLPARTRYPVKVSSSKGRSQACTGHPLVARSCRSTTPLIGFSRAR